MRDDDDGHAQPLVDFLQRGQHRARGLGVQRGRGFVTQQHAGLGRQRPRNGHPLLLAARQLGRVVIQLVDQAHHLGTLAHPRRNGSPVMPAVDAQRESDVVGHRGVLQQVELLEDHADLLAGIAQPLLVQRRQLLAGHEDPTAVGALQQVHQPQQRGLACTTAPDEPQRIATRDGQRHVTHRVKAVAPVQGKGLVELFQPDQRFLRNGLRHHAPSIPAG